MMLPIAPGEYLALRRVAAGLTVADVAAQIATVPRLGELDRQQLVMSIEADARPATIHTISALRGVYPFSVDVLARLVSIADGCATLPPRICCACGCSELDPCEVGFGGACCWVAEDLCSSCPAPAIGAAVSLDDAGPDDACAARPAA